MKTRIGILAFLIVFGLAFVAVAQETKEEPAKEPAKNEEVAKPATPPAEAPATAPAAAPVAAPTAVPAAAPVVAPAAAPAAAPTATAPASVPAAVPAAAPKPVAPPPLSPCAQSLQPLAESYKKSYDDMQKWIAQVNTETSAASEKVQKLQAQIKANEEAIAKAKAGDDSSKAKEITKQNKGLSKDLEAAKKAETAASDPVAKMAADRVKQYEADADKALADLKARSK